MCGVTMHRLAFILSLFSYTVSMHAVDRYDTVTAHALDLWTDVDLVRSINTTSLEKELFMDQIACKALALYVQVATAPEPSPDDLLEGDRRMDLLALLTDINVHVQEVFHEVAHPALSTTLYILTSLVHGLKTPIYRTC